MKAKTIVVIAGLPTSGKTSLGQTLAQATSVHFIDIDEGPSLCVFPQVLDPATSEDAIALDKARMRVAYSTLHAAVAANLAEGFSVIISATYSRHENQDIIQSVIEENGGIMKVILCQYNDTPEEAGRRIADRVASHKPGGCRTFAHYLEVKNRYMGIKLPHLTVMMDGGQAGMDKATQQALSYINN